ncbi:hypothetical protein BJ944DRAFT_273567 [Cunninghamella echinulata]|nr:hypothetical protein BJ944DRAFT_273567 [Cunninghamella echinulata]
MKTSYILMFLLIGLTLFLRVIKGSPLMEHSIKKDTIMGSSRSKIISDITNYKLALTNLATTLSYDYELLEKINPKIRNTIATANHFDTLIANSNYNNDIYIPDTLCFQDITSLVENTRFIIENVLEQDDDPKVHQVANSLGNCIKLVVMDLHLSNQIGLSSIDIALSGRNQA